MTNMMNEKETIFIPEPWDEEDRTQLLDEAIRFAVECHSGQKRKASDTPYIVHPLEVLTILSAMHADIDVQIAGVLHDTVEDTGATVEEIRERFGDRAADLVEENSEDKTQSWEARKRHTIETLPDASFDLKCLVLADKLSNMRSIIRDYYALGEEVWTRFNRGREQQSWYYSGIIDALDGLQNDERVMDFYWELNDLYKDAFVEYFFDEEKGILWQKPVDTDAYYITWDNTFWRPWYGDENVNAVKVPRLFAERMEDNWTEGMAAHGMLTLN